MSARSAVPAHDPTTVPTGGRRRPGAATWFATVVAVVLAATLLVAPPASAATVSAQTLLNQLTTGADTATTTYDRARFRHWVDADGDGCDTRAEVLKDESSVATSHTGTCTITTGRWTSLYDGVTTTTASGFDIDHMVPLKEAWISGGAAWTDARRQSFANDLAYAPSLIAVSASSNRSKSDQDPDSWMPPASSYACTYVKEWIAVKWRWNLRIDSAERSALQGELDRCSSTSVVAPSRA